MRLICLRANTASALKSTPGPSSNEKTILVYEKIKVTRASEKNKLERRLHFKRYIGVSHLEKSVGSRDNGFPCEHKKPCHIISVILNRLNFTIKSSTSAKLWTKKKETVKENWKFYKTWISSATMFNPYISAALALATAAASLKSSNAICYQFNS